MAAAEFGFFIRRVFSTHAFPVEGKCAQDVFMKKGGRLVLRLPLPFCADDYSKVEMTDHRPLLRRACSLRGFLNANLMPEGTDHGQRRTSRLPTLRRADEEVEDPPQVHVDDRVPVGLL
jgi:hypothetical protein